MTGRATTPRVAPPPGYQAGSAEPRLPRPQPWALSTIGLLGLGVAALLVSVAYGQVDEDNPALWAFFFCWVELSYVIAGLVAWRRRPESRLGPLMLFAGFGTSISFLTLSQNAVLYTIGLAGDTFAPVFFLHVFLAYPTGRLRGGPDRVVVVGAYLAAAIALPEMVLGIGGDLNLIALVQAPGAAELLQHVQLVALTALMLAGIALLVRRRLGGARPIRAASGWLVDSFAIGLLMIALLLTAANLQSDWAPRLRIATFFVIGLAPFVFLFGLLQARLVRSSVGDLLVDLGTNPGPTRLQEAVARALRDPSATVVYWLPELDGFADAQGRRVDPAGEADRSMTSVQREGVTVAALVHDAALDDEPQLLAAVARAVGMAVENSQLQVELQARLADVRASRARIVTAGDAERRRLERDLHDGAQQRLVALSLALRRAQHRLEPGSDTALETSLDDAAQLVHDALAELRELARGLHPAVLIESGLPGALAALAARSPASVTLAEVPGERFAPDVEAAVYFLASEALTNVAKHAPEASASVRVELRPGGVQIEISDDGPGGARARDGSGLEGMEDRLAALGGTLRVRSEPGAGTRLEAWIPIETGDPDAT